MTSTPHPPRTGMPTWLKVLLVIFIVIALGCCGIFGTCIYLGRKVASNANDWAKQIQKEAEKQQADARKRLEEQGNASPDGSPEATPEAPSSRSPSSRIPSSATVRLPANFPNDMPLYSGMAPMHAFSNNMNDSGSVVFSSSDSVDDIAAYYKKEMAAKGWTAQSDTTISGASMQSYTKSGHEALITISADKKITSVAITYAKQ